MIPLRIDSAERRPLLIVALIAMVEALLLFLISYRQAGGHFLFPLDDAYIHLQYARSMASGDFLVYTAGTAPSGGMTSPLYVMLLAPLFLVGLGGAKAAFAAFLFGTGCWALANVWLHQLARRMWGDSMAMVASGLMLTNGHLLWNFLAGMETGLVALLLLAVAGFARQWWEEESGGARLMLFAALALLPLARPEGGIAAVAVALVVLMRRGERPRLSLLTLACCLLPFLLWLGVLKMGTGDWRPAGMIVKGVSSAPHAPWTEKLAFVAQNLWAIPSRFLFNVVPDDGWAAFKGTHFLSYFAPGFGLLVLMGFGLLIAGDVRGGKRGAGLLVALLWAGSLVAACTGLFPFSHHQRYIAPATPLAICLGCAALRHFSQLFQQLENKARRGIAVALVLCSLPSVPWWMAEHGRNARDLYNLLREATFRLEADRSPLAITDAGILAYYTNRPTTDLVGLTTASMAPAALHGPGATAESLSRLSQAARPENLATYREWFDRDFPLRDPLWTLTIPRTTMAWGATLGLYPIDWEAIDRADQPPAMAGMSLLLDVDVADLQSEAAAGYEWTNRAGDTGPNLLALELTPSVRFDLAATTGTISLVEGGRIVRGERFELRGSSVTSLADNLHLVGRLAPPEGLAAPAPTALRVMVTSAATGYSEERLLSFPAEPTERLHLSLGPILDRVGGVVPGGGDTRWIVQVLPSEPVDAAWTSCHWWVFREPGQSTRRPDESP